MFSAGMPIQFLRASSKVRLLAIAVSGAVLAAAVPVGSQAGHIDKLQQSVDLIRQILDKDGLFTRTSTSSDGSYKSVTERKFSVKSANGCQLVVTSDVHTHAQLPGQQSGSDRVWLEVFRPDFSALDPATVVVQDPRPPQPTWETKGYLVRIAVQTGKAPIVVSSVNKETNKEQNLPGVPSLAVYVTSREQADRLAKAFTQAANACHAAK